MLDKILFWVVLVWMIGLLVMGFIAVRQIWREASQSPTEPDTPPPTPPGGAGQKPGDEGPAGS